MVELKTEVTLKTLSYIACDQQKNQLEAVAGGTLMDCKQNVQSRSIPATVQFLVQSMPIY